MGQKFATEDEKAFASVLDLLGVRWEYEPHLFPLRVTPDGKIKEGFRPDFYLPDRDVYIEITAAISKEDKNRKARLLAERHPDVKVIVLFVRGILISRSEQD